jgi:hypothetical protein
MEVERERIKTWQDRTDARAEKGLDPDADSEDEVGSGDPLYWAPAPLSWALDPPVLSTCPPYHGHLTPL